MMFGRRGGRWFALVLLAPSGWGCSLAPRSFQPRDLMNPAPLVRARAVTMGDRLPSRIVIPALLERLDDPDPVVRLTAHEELRRRTGQDFGYHAWDDRVERGSAIARWQAWWSGRLAAPQPVRATPQRPIRQVRWAR